MSIAWQYLDKRSAAVNALKDYESMKYVLAHTSEDVALLRTSMAKIDSPLLSDLPKTQHNVRSRENQVAKHLDAIDILGERYSRAQEFCAWFEPAWAGLSEAERYVLSCFYFTETETQDSVGTICDHFHIERSSAYKKKDRALSHLTLLLYGK